jgi:hypothetical protein
MLSKDYTRLPLGATIDGGEIKLCPLCGKLGLAVERPESGKVHYTHSQSLEFDQEGGVDFQLGDHTVDLVPEKTPESD